MGHEPNKVREAHAPFKHLAEGTLVPPQGGVRQVPIKEAKAKLTELLRQVEAGEKIVLTRHGKPVVDLVPHAAGAEEKPMSVLERLEAWHKAHPSPDIGWIADDFDEPLPEDFLLQPFPDDFDKKLAEHDRRIEEARRKTFGTNE